ncbi:MAG TPA: hypothetical protein VGL48_06960 [Acidimicrobiales bacterium]
MTDAAANRGEPVRPPMGRGFSMRAAMIVPGLGVLILGVFIGAGFLTSNPVQAPDKSTASATVAGTSLRALPALTDLKAITLSGEPPGNILNSVSVPQGATLLSHQDNSAAADQFDAQIGLKSDASQGALDTFYTLDMKRQGWQIFETGPADHDPGAVEVLGKKAGSDGFYWEMGAVVSATTFGPDAPPRGDTAFTVRLFQVPDPD